MALEEFMCSKDQVDICKTVTIKCIFCIKPNRFLMIVANTKNTKKRDILGACKAKHMEVNR